MVKTRLYVIDGVTFYFQQLGWWENKIFFMEKECCSLQVILFYSVVKQAYSFLSLVSASSFAWTGRASLF